MFSYKSYRKYSTFQKCKVYVAIQTIKNSMMILMWNFCYFPLFFDKFTQDYNYSMINVFYHKWTQIQFQKMFNKYTACHILMKRMWSDDIYLQIEISYFKWYLLPGSVMLHWTLAGLEKWNQFHKNESILKWVNPPLLKLSVKPTSDTTRTRC